MQDRVARLLPYFLLSLCVLPFLPGLNGPFLLDDTFNLTSARVPSGTWSELLDAIFRNASGLFRRPIANLSFVANYHLLGQEPFHYKLVNLLLHLLVGILIWRLSTRLLALLYPDLPETQTRLVALLAAAAWILHPLQVSTVLYAVQRMSQLSALFMVLFVLACLRRFQENREQTLSTGRALLAAAGAWALALLAVLSKENGVLAPLLLLAVWLSLPAISRQSFTVDGGRRLLFALTGWLPVAAGVLGGVFLLGWIASGFASREFSQLERVLTQPFVLAHYLQTILIPDFRQMGLYLDDIAVRTAGDHLAWLALAITLALPLVALAIRRRAPALCFAVLWFYACHALESSIFPLEMAFEHRNYLALFGPVLAAAHYLFQASTRILGSRRRLAALLVFLVLASNTLFRAHQWSSPELFVVGEARHHPGSPRAQNAAASFDAQRGNIPAMIARVKTVQTLRPDNYWPWAQDMLLACGLPGHAVHWRTMMEKVEKRPQENTINDMLRLVAMNYMEGHCPHLPKALFDQHVAQVADVFKRRDMPSYLEKTLIVRSYLARLDKDEARYRELLSEAARIYPGGTVALSDLAYYELNAGNLDEAEAAIAQLRARIGQGSERYKVAELEGFLRQARREATAAKQESGAVP